jgi:hypothetical protein
MADICLLNCQRELSELCEKESLSQNSAVALLDDKNESKHSMEELNDRLDKFGTELKKFKAEEEIFTKEEFDEMNKNYNVATIEQPKLPDVATIEQPKLPDVATIEQPKLSDVVQHIHTYRRSLNGESFGAFLLRNMKKIFP